MCQTFRRLFFLLLILPVTSFAQTRLQGEYKETPYTFESKKSYDQVWEDITGFFSARGISIQTIDKASGVITSTGFSFLTNNPRNERKGKPESGSLFTYEDKKTKRPTNPESWVVLNKLVDGKLWPVKITGNINVYVKRGDQQTITIHLSNLVGESNNTRDKWRFFQVKSTGILEQTIFNKL
jgi:hypothetical protein